MTDPLFLTDRGALADVRVGSSVTLAGAEGRHAVTVARLKTGQQVRIGDGAGTVAQCRVTEVGRAELRAEALDVSTDPPAVPSLTLIQALAKGDRDLLAIEVATELGVDEVLPWQAERSVVRWRGERADKGRAKWRHTVVSATKQARRSRIPTVGQVADRAAVCARIASATTAWVLHESAQTPLATVATADALRAASAAEIVLIVGPEGGVTDEEQAAFVGAGAQLVRLGPTVLRTSTAGPAAISVISASSRWLS